MFPPVLWIVGVGAAVGAMWVGAAVVGAWVGSNGEGGGE